MIKLLLMFDIIRKAILRNIIESQSYMNWEPINCNFGYGIVNVFIDVQLFMNTIPNMYGISIEINDVQSFTISAPICRDTSTRRYCSIMSIYCRFFVEMRSRTTTTCLARHPRYCEMTQNLRWEPAKAGCRGRKKTVSAICFNIFSKSTSIKSRQFDT